MQIGHDTYVEDPYIEAVFFRLFTVADWSITKVDGGISFQGWATLNSGVGIVYYPHGTLAPRQPGDPRQLIMWATTIEPLSVPGWFYYAESVERWRREFNDGRRHE